MVRVLTIDIGASALKAAVFAFERGDAAGPPTPSEAAAPLAFDEGPDGRSEIAPARWREALEAALGRLDRAEGGLGRIEAVCVCGMTRTQVPVDAAGRALAPALGVRDARAATTAAEARRAAGDGGEGARLDASHPAARLLWLSRAAPEVFARAEAVLEPKDWLNALLTGVLASDPVSMERLTAAHEGGDGSLAARIGLSRDLRPPLSAPAREIGRVRRGLGGALEALAGARVLTGSHDARMAAAGLGALRPGGAYVISGTTESAGLLAPAPAEAPGLLTVRWDPGLWQIGGPGLNGAAIRDWAARVLAGDAAPAPPPERPLLFLPFLKGERTPFWDAELRAAFLGLDAAHGPGDMVRAAMEGLAFLNRVVIERAERAAGLRADRVALAGGGAAEPWPAIRANALGREIAVPGLRHAGLAGCAATARLALGLSESLEAAAAAVTGPPRIVAPDPALAPRMEALFAAYEAALEPLAGISHQLAAVPGAPAVACAEAAE